MHVIVSGSIHLSFIDPERGGFGKILPSAMIFPEGLATEKYATEKIALHGHCG